MKYSHLSAILFDPNVKNCPKDLKKHWQFSEDSIFAPQQLQVKLNLLF